MNWRIEWPFSILALLLVLWSCKSDPYADMKERELDSGVRNDSVFLGLSFGMERKVFFDHCWDLNRKKIVKEGPANSSVEYRLGDLLKADAVMQFYPNFHNERAYEMQISFYYEGWAPWNRQLFSDTMRYEVKDLLANWYDTEFMELKNTKAGDVFVSMEGNRRIVIGHRDERIVDVAITDMSVADKVRKDPFIK